MSELKKKFESEKLGKEQKRGISEKKKLEEH